MKDLINAPPTRHISINNESTISTNITIGARIETVESNIDNLNNSANHMAHML